MRHAILVFSLIALVGCVEQEIEQTLYLETDGTATWVLEITNLSPEDPAKSLDQYFGTLEEISAGRETFQELMIEAGAWETEIRLLRDEPPLRYQLTGRFARPDPVFAVLFAEQNIAWETVTDEAGEVLRFSVPDEKTDVAAHPLELIVVEGKRYLVDSLGQLAEAEIRLP